MKLKYIYAYFLTVLVITWVACKKPYYPDLASPSTNYLIVEGFININNDTTIISLSRTVGLKSNSFYKPETGAKVIVESSTGNTNQLSEQGNGKYIYPGLNVPATQKYRLRITTSSGSTYLSDFVEAKSSPPIDSISWKLFSDHLQLYLSTHDPLNKTLYYKWDFGETWKFHAHDYSGYMTNGKAIVARGVGDDIFTCWSNDSSSNVLLASTAKLSKDVVYETPLTSIASNSMKVSVKYSVYVKQTPLTEQGFNFWESLRKNTEQLGSIFDAQPSEISGNIHNVNNATEPVIGFISAGTTSGKRIFISNDALPRSWIPKYPFACVPPPDTAWKYNPKTHEDDIQKTLIPGYALPLDAITQNGIVIGYTDAVTDCADCRVLGTKKMPPFWQQ